MRPLLALLFALVGLAAAEVVNANVASLEAAPLLRESEPFRVTLTVANPHDRAVRVERLDTSCACGKLKLGSEFLLPYGRTTLEVEVDDRMRSGDQEVRVTAFLTDPELEPIEIVLRWKVRPAVSVDAIPPGQPPPATGRPEAAWRDVYRYVASERPDEPQRLKKRILLACPPEETPAEGFKVLAIEYAGSLWAFDLRPLGDGRWLIVATARDREKPMPVGRTDEAVTVRTNHPDKAAIALRFQAWIDQKAGTEQADPMDDHPDH
jgi:hypothetical protein